MSLEKRIIKVLDQLKYFGFRYLYYHLLKKRFPYIYEYLLDIIKPSLNSRYISQKILKEYWGYIGHGAKQSDFLGLGLVHYSLIRMMKPKRVLCIGSYRGFVPAICALACQDSQKGVVDFVDAGLDLSKIHPTFGDGYWKKADSKKHFEKIVEPKYLKTYVMTSEDFIKKYPLRRYGYIYIDGDHTYNGVKKDFEMMWFRLDKGGLMAFHDVLGKGDKIKFGVKKFWQELSDKNRIILPHPKVSGLGIIQKT